MKIFFFFLIVLNFTSCSKQKTVMICGDHVCINKGEAEQFFQDNLFIEVKFLNNDYSSETDLVELNLRSNESGNKEIIVFNKEKTNKKLKTLSKEQVSQKKIELKEKKLEKRTKEEKEKVASKIQKIIIKDPIINNKNIHIKKKLKKPILNNEINVNNKTKKVVDICTVVKKCNIEEISEYLIKKGDKKKFPDISTKE